MNNGIIKAQAAYVIVTGAHELQQTSPQDSDGGVTNLPPVDPDAPPRRLSSSPTHPDFRPDFMRVGLLVDGKECKTALEYDADKGIVKITSGIYLRGVTIEPFWRYAETRQHRRMMARWRAKQK